MLVSTSMASPLSCACLPFPAFDLIQLAVIFRHFESTTLPFRSLDTTGWRQRFLRLVNPIPKYSSSSPSSFRYAISRRNSASALSISGTVREQYTSFLRSSGCCCGLLVLAKRLSIFTFTYLPFDMQQLKIAKILSFQFLKAFRVHSDPSISRD